MANEHLEEISEAEMAVFKKKLRALLRYKGKGTELISLYLPPDVDRSLVMGQLTEEMSQSGNIKSPTTRKNVQGALRKVQNFLKVINFRLPEKGLVVFCGNVSDVEGKSDIQLFSLRPMKRLNVKLYWCDSEFHLGPLEEMAQPSEVFGILTIDKNEATIAIIVGKKYEILGHFTSNVAGKTRAGGQCLLGNSLVQLSDGNIVGIEGVGNPAAVKSVNFGDCSVGDSFISNKWKANKPSALKIITRYPRLSIACSADHGFFCWNNGTIEEKPASGLKEGMFLVMPEKIETAGNEQALNTNCFNSYVVSEKGLKFLITARAKLGLSQEKFAKKLGLHQASISRFELGKFNPRLGYLEKICNAMNLDFNDFAAEFCMPKSGITLPKIISPKLAQIAGYLAGDGNIEAERLNFSEGNKETAEFYAKLLQQTFNANVTVRFRKGKNYYLIRCGGKPIVRLFRQEFPEACVANSPTIPKKILKSKNSVLAGFLKGLFDAEGYATKRGLSLGMNNETIVKQAQLAMLRFGILASVYEYDNRRNPYSKKTRFTLDITEKKSLETFRNAIGFSSPAKRKKLEALAKSKGIRSCVRQLFISGKEVRKLFEQEGLNTMAFPAVSNFFRNQRMMGKEAFRKSVIARIKNNKALAEKFEKIASIPLLPVKIHKIEKIGMPTKMFDITVENQNFIANGLVVHNSAHRFERLREEAAHDFYKRISEKMNGMFLPYGGKLKGLIIAGPGITKNYFLNQQLMDHRIRNLVIGTIDTSYTDESGIRETVQKSSELLKGAEITKERQSLESFFEAIVKSGLGTYGRKEVETALQIGRVDTLLLSEQLEWWVYKFKCDACGAEHEVVVQNQDDSGAKKFVCEKCGGKKAELTEQVDYMDWMMEKAQSTGAKTKIISTDTPEGEQFYKGFGGVGAILRYR
ncbi:MAG: peptide chain release factor aRF-1 [archaeon]